jgi:hypothetical protein
VEINKKDLQVEEGLLGRGNEIGKERERREDKIHMHYRSFTVKSINLCN